ncbi:MAG: WxcM-like domain-containing protein [Blastocatellia bacterium]|nr:WxcM-like domain-containing protein [Blastocatellia bacterium]
MKKLRSYARRSDDRGSFIGLINEGIWKEVNYVHTRAGAVRGKHFSKETHELVFLLKGEVEIELQDVNDPTQQVTFHLREGEGIEIMPYTYRVMRYLTDCEQISLLNKPFDETNPDLHNLET